MEAIYNKKANFNYEILDRLEVGIVLTGIETKSIKTGQVNITEAFVKILGSELYLINANITRYKFSSDITYDALRTRKLLAKRIEIQRLVSKIKQGNLTLIPLKIYSLRGKLKLEIGMVKGKKHYEKKLREKERTLKKEFDREKRQVVV